MDPHNSHYHFNEQGFLKRCYHKTRPARTVSFWCGMTLGFPIEHVLWEKLPPFSSLSHLLGL